MRSKGDNDYNKESDRLNEDIDEYIKELELSLGNMEKIGVAFLLAGYANYIFAANLDILEALDKNNTGQSPEEAFVFGQKLVVLGYTLLFIVASKRIYLKSLSNTYEGDEENLNPYYVVANSYLLSGFANLMRLQAFIDIDNMNKEKKEIEDSTDN